MDLDEVKDAEKDQGVGEDMNVGRGSIRIHHPKT